MSSVRNEDFSAFSYSFCSTNRGCFVPNVGDDAGVITLTFAFLFVLGFTVVSVSPNTRLRRFAIKNLVFVEMDAVA